ncbi:caprin-1-like isoform X2 [Tubulanus polymorphus]|uniref:caprin-1-like isoform X2 n=1 Tax=Tubulanus polymorphus TaxID=672921 RepID=UPI003DA305FD
MPSASAKADKPASGDVTDPNKQFLVTIDKKIRNLEKKKTKLDSIKEKVNQGATLNADQEDAISKYDGVALNLDFLRDLHKQYVQFLTDLEKEQKRAKKRERQEQRAEEQRRLQEVLFIQNMLDAMGSETAREDFTNGSNNAVKLTEEQLDSLDELYKLVSPSREDNDKDINEQFASCSEHLMNLVDGKEKEILGTTYSALRALLTTISESGYFNAPDDVAAAEPEMTTATEPVEEPTSVTETTPDTDDKPHDQNGVLGVAEPEEMAPVEHNFGVMSTTADIGLVPTELPEVSAIIPDPMLSSQQERVTDATEATIVDDSFFAATPAFPPSKLTPQQRPANEIVSSVQGSFNFLQDSVIDPESPHMDPAVLAAHPLNPHHTQQQDLTQNTSLSQQQQTYQMLEEQKPSQKASATDYTSQSYGQNMMSQSTAVSQESETPDVPQPIPLPNQSQTSEEKKFQMNANAAVFRSMYDGGSGEFNEMDEKMNEQSSDYNSSSSGYNSYSRNSGGNSYNNRGRGGRGGNRGNSSNGYQPRGSRGGQYGGNRGGYNSGNNRGGSGRGSYQGQGYNSRNDYNRSDGGSSGYQGYGSSYGGYQNKPNNRGRGGYNRDGGSSRGRGGGASSGGSRGAGYGSKPMGSYNSNQQ